MFDVSQNLEFIGTFPMENLNFFRNLTYGIPTVQFLKPVDWIRVSQVFDAFLEWILNPYFMIIFF